MGISEFNNLEDLVFSRSFRDWVLNPDSVEKGYWENWMAGHPEKADMVRQAKAMIYSLHVERTMPSEKEVDREVRKAIARLRDAPRYIPIDGPVSRPSRLRPIQVFLVAALLAGICVAGFLYYRSQSQRNVLRSFLGAHRSDRVKQQTTALPDAQPLLLPDGSLVRLGRDSKLYYPAFWAGGGTPREVYLDGEAYFNVRRYPASPFCVYTSRLITRALGTSFLVHAFPGETSTGVTVLTGKVSVCREEDFYARPSGSLYGIVLGRNQEAVEDRLDARLSKTVTRMPELPEDRPDTGFAFCRTPLRQVFSTLEDSYGIPIQYDSLTVDSCSLTATLDNRSYFTKLNQVCQAVGASYEVIDGNIVVTARKCK